MTFEAEYDQFGERTVVPLVPNGEYIPVTKGNRQEYVSEYVNWVLNTSISTQFDAFKSGFFEVCGGNALSLFKPEEIEMMIRGDDDIDFEQLQSVTEYEMCRQDDLFIRDFWAIVSGWDKVMRQKLLTFITGTDRIPATGIQTMKFKITCIGDDCEKLPSSHTCFNQLSLYRYRDKEKMEAKLRKAIDWSSGFHVR